MTGSGPQPDRERLNRKLAQVRALLAQAEDQAATAAEAEAYNRKASELIAQYGIDAAMLNEADPSADSVADRVIDVEAPYAYDKVTLLNVIAEACRCRAVAKVAKRSVRNRWSVHLFGFGSDLDRVDLLYTSLLLQAAAGVVATPAPPRESVGAFRRSWLAGFSVAVMKRLKEAEASARDAPGTERRDGRSVALVLADRTSLVDRRVEARYPRLNQSRGRSLSGSGYGAGHAAGRRADLGSDRASVSRANSRLAVGGR